MVSSDKIKGIALLVLAAMMACALVVNKYERQPPLEVEDISAQTADGRDINFPLLPATVWSGAGRGER